MVVTSIGLPFLHYLQLYNAISLPTIFCGAEYSAGLKFINVAVELRAHGSRIWALEAFREAFIAMRQASETCDSFFSAVTTNVEARIDRLRQLVLAEKLSKAYDRLEATQREASSSGRTTIARPAYNARVSTAMDVISVAMEMRCGLPNHSVCVHFSSTDIRARGLDIKIDSSVVLLDYALSYRSLADVA